MPVCPRCGGQTEPVHSEWVGPILYCSRCGTGESTANHATVAPVGSGQPSDRAKGCQDTSDASTGELGRFTRALKLPGLDRGKQSRRVHQREDEVQPAIVKALRAAGYTVRSTVHRYRMQTCPCCGHAFWPKGGYGADKAVADLQVRDPSWPRGFHKAIEVKGSNTRLSPEQAEAQAAGEIIVCRSVEEAQEAVRGPGAGARGERTDDDREVCVKGQGYED